MDMRYLVAFPITSLVIFAVGGIIVLLYGSYLSRNNQGSIDVSIANRLKGPCLGLSGLLLLNITVETVMRYYYLSVREFWLPDGSPLLYNNPVQVGIEWMVAIISILWFHMPLITLRGGTVIKDVSMAKAVCFLGLPAGRVSSFRNPDRRQLTLLVCVIRIRKFSN